MGTIRDMFAAGEPILLPVRSLKRVRLFEEKKKREKVFAPIVELTLALAHRPDPRDGTAWEMRVVIRRNDTSRR